jgi:hypothetical protein
MYVQRSPLPGEGSECAHDVWVIVDNQNRRNPARLTLSGISHELTSGVTSVCEPLGRWVQQKCGSDFSLLVT